MAPDLRAELLHRAEREQAARRSREHEAAIQVDAENLPWLKQVIADVGWPGRSAVGSDGANAAWLGDEATVDCAICGQTLRFDVQVPRGRVTD
jgi:hypothetical protein